MAVIDIVRGTEAQAFVAEDWACNLANTLEERFGTALAEGLEIKVEFAPSTEADEEREREIERGENGDLVL